MAVFGETRWRWIAGFTWPLTVMAMVAACSSDDGHAARGTGGTSGQGGDAGHSSGKGGRGGNGNDSAGNGGSGDGGEPAAIGGAAGSTMEGGAGDGGSSAGGCVAGETTCIENTPATCEQGEWVSGEACSGELPACSNGVCAAAKLSGGFVSVAPVTDAAGDVRVTDQRFEMAPTTCGTVAGKKVCVTGGIRP